MLRKLLLSLRQFILEVCGTNGALHWLMLVLIVLGVSINPFLSVAVCEGGFLLALTLYTHNKLNPDSALNISDYFSMFITQCCGAGGACFWLLTLFGAPVVLLYPVTLGIFAISTGFYAYKCARQYYHQDAKFDRHLFGMEFILTVCGVGGASAWTITSALVTATKLSLITVSATVISASAFYVAIPLASIAAAYYIYKNAGKFLHQKTLINKLDAEEYEAYQQLSKNALRTCAPTFKKTNELENTHAKMRDDILVFIYFYLQKVNIAEHRIGLAAELIKSIVKIQGPNDIKSHAGNAALLWSTLKRTKESAEKVHQASSFFSPYITKSEFACQAEEIFLRHQKSMPESVVEDPDPMIYPKIVST